MKLNKKIKKQYALNTKLAIAVDVLAAKKQIASSSVVEDALEKYFQSNPVVPFNPRLVS